MSLDIDAIVKQMLEAAKGVVTDKWPTTRSYFESESKAFAARLATIVQLRASGSISDARAKQLVEFQKNAWETVLITVEGLNQLLVEEALNAALAVIRGAVNTAIGFALL